MQEKPKSNMYKNLFNQERILEDTENYATSLAVGWEQFSELVSSALNNASKLTRLPLSGDRWEEILVSVFERLGHTVTWRPGSHAPGADIMLGSVDSGIIRISVKAGSIAMRARTEKVLKFSSYRLTRHANIEAKIKFIDADADHVDWYLFGAREDTSAQRSYHIYLTKATIIQAVTATWEETKGGWAGLQPNGVALAIVKNMSDQLWVDIPLRLINGKPDGINEETAGAHLATIVIPTAQLGSRIDVLFSDFLDQNPERKEI